MIKRMLQAHLTSAPSSRSSERLSTEDPSFGGLEMKRPLCLPPNSNLVPSLCEGEGPLSEGRSESG
jgi:hypothetical protein